MFRYSCCLCNQVQADGREPYPKNGIQVQPTLYNIYSYRKFPNYGNFFICILNFHSIFLVIPIIISIFAPKYLEYDYS